MDLFNLDLSRFPTSTQDILPIDIILKHAALPLGFKKSYWLFRERKYLNVGFLTPTKDHLRAIEALVKQSGISGIHAFRVSRDQFLETLSKIYHLSSGQIKKRSPEALHDALRG